MPLAEAERRFNTLQQMMQQQGAQGGRAPRRQPGSRAGE